MLLGALCFRLGMGEGLEKLGKDGVTVSTLNLMAEYIFTLEFSDMSWLTACYQQEGTR